MVFEFDIGSVIIEHCGDIVAWEGVRCVSDEETRLPRAKEVRLDIFEHLKSKK